MSLIIFQRSFSKRFDHDLSLVDDFLKAWDLQKVFDEELDAVRVADSQEMNIQSFK